jgi:FkbM family methyltransferase
MYARSYLASIYTEYPEYSGELARLLQIAIRTYPDLGMLDVGASYGDTVAIAKSVADIPIVCIEGDQRTLMLLERNLRQFNGVSVHGAILGERRQALNAVLEDDGGNMRIRPTDAGEGALLTMTTLDHITGSLQYPERYRLLKIDTEGFDCRILRGGREFIASAKPIIAMEYHRLNMRRIGEEGLPTLWQLRELGYHDAFFFDNGGRFILATSLDQEEVIQDLHDYADGKEGGIFYYDLYLFHSDDTKIAASFKNEERARRA